MKAIVSALGSGLIAGLSSLLTALQGEHAGFGTITAGQWVTAAIAFLVGSGVGHGVYRVSPTTAPAAATPATTPAGAATPRATTTVDEPAAPPATAPALTQQDRSPAATPPTGVRV